jgi:CheY-like chemotaxis protein
MPVKPLRLLIVEDDEDFQVVLRKETKRLESEVAVETCILGSVADAQKVMGLTHIDFILSDFELPDGTGADVMDHAQDSSPSSHKIVLTGVPERARKETDQRTPPHDVWDKAIGLNELRRRLVRLVSSRAPLPAV